MSDISQADIHTLKNLDALAKNAMRSKVILKQLSSLQDRHLIEFDPFNHTAKLTPSGELVLATEQS